jgi:myo-inositol catabolism protein IolC
VLGAGAGDERVRRWLRVAATTPGYIGFAIGRSIWRDPIRAHLDGELSREAAAAAVRDRFLHFAYLYLRG